MMADAPADAFSPDDEILRSAMRLQPCVSASANLQYLSSRERHFAATVSRRALR